MDKETAARLPGPTYRYERLLIHLNAPIVNVVPASAPKSRDNKIYQLSYSASVYIDAYTIFTTNDQLPSSADRQNIYFGRCRSIRLFGRICGLQEVQAKIVRIKILTPAVFEYGLLREYNGYTLHDRIER